MQDAESCTPVSTEFSATRNSLKTENPIPRNDDLKDLIGKRMDLSEKRSDGLIAKQEEFIDQSNSTLLTVKGEIDEFSANQEVSRKSLDDIRLTVDNQLLHITNLAARLDRAESELCKASSSQSVSPPKSDSVSPPKQDAKQRTPLSLCCPL